MNYTIGITLAEPFGCLKPESIGSFEVSTVYSNPDTNPSKTDVVIVDGKWIKKFQTNVSSDMDLPAQPTINKTCMVGFYPTGGNKYLPFYDGKVGVYKIIGEVNPGKDILVISPTEAAFSPYKFHETLFREGWNAFSVFAANDNESAVIYFDKIINDIGIASGIEPKDFTEQLLTMICLTFQDKGTPVYLPKTTVFVIPEGGLDLSKAGGGVGYVNAGGIELTYENALLKVGGFNVQTLQLWSDLVGTSPKKGEFSKYVASLIQKNAESGIVANITKDMLMSNWNLICSQTPEIVAVQEDKGKLDPVIKKSKTGLYVGIGGVIVATVVVTAWLALRNRKHNV